jgi:hypothetical protein
MCLLEPAYVCRHVSHDVGCRRLQGQTSRLPNTGSRHKFNADEWAGFARAVKKNTEHIDVRIQGQDAMRLFRPHPPTPVLPATSVLLNDRNGLLRTRGLTASARRSIGYEHNCDHDRHRDDAVADRRPKQHGDGIDPGGGERRAPKGRRADDTIKAKGPSGDLRRAGR